MTVGDILQAIRAVGEFFGSLPRPLGEGLLYPLLLGLAALALGLAFRSVACLGFAQSMLKKIARGRRLQLFLDSKIGAIFLRRALKALGKNDRERALSEFGDALEHLDRARAKSPHSGKLREMLADPRLAALYCLRAWNSCQTDDYQDAIAAAEEALRLDLAVDDARICRGWAKLRRNSANDAVEAEVDFAAVLQSRQVHYFGLGYADWGRADALRLQGEYPKSIAAYSDLIAANGQWAEGYARRAQCRYFMNDQAGAVEDVTRAVSLGCQYHWLFAYRGDAYRTLGRFAEAIRDCEEAMRRAPGAFEGYYVCGRTHYQQSQEGLTPEKKSLHLQEAQKHLRTAAQIATSVGRQFPEMHYALAAVEGELGHSDEAQRLRQQARSASPGGTAQARTPVKDALIFWPAVKEAFALADVPDLPTTLNELTELIKQRPWDVRAHYAAGLLHLKVAERAAKGAARTAELEEAIRLFDQVIPDVGDAYYWRAHVYGQSRNWIKALDDCARAIQHNPNMPQAYWLQANIKRLKDPRDDVRPDLERALELSNAAIDQGAGDPPLFSLRAELHLRLSQAEQAIEDATTALRSPDANAGAHRTLAKAYLQLLRFEDAIREAGLTIGIDPKDAEAYCIRGEAYRQSWNFDASDTDLTEAISLAPEYADAFLSRGWARVGIWENSKDRGALTGAANDFARVIALAGNHPAGYCGRSMVRLKETEIGETRLDEALADSRTALELDPKFAFAHYVRGWIFLAKNELHVARKEFGEAIDSGFIDPDVYFGRAESERLLGARGEAVNNFSEAIKTAAAQGRTLWRGYWHRALVLVEEQRWAEAARDYEAALADARNAGLDRSDSATLYTNFGWVYYELERDSAMEEAFAKAEEFDPKLSFFLSTRGAALLYRGRFDEAIRCFSRLVEVDPKSAEGYTNRGLTRIYQGEINSAIEDLRIAIRVNDKDSRGWHTRGWARIRDGDWNGAVSDCTKAIELLPSEPFRFNDRALGRFWLGLRREAIEDLQKVLEIRLSNFTLDAPRRVREDKVTWGATALDWTRAVEKRPRDFLTYLGRGISLWMAGDLEAAARDIQKATKLNRRALEAEQVRELVERERRKLLAPVTPSGRSP